MMIDGVEVKDGLRILYRERTPRWKKIWRWLRRQPDEKNGVYVADATTWSDSSRDLFVEKLERFAEKHYPDPVAASVLMSFLRGECRHFPSETDCELCATVPDIDLDE